MIPLKVGRVNMPGNVIESQRLGLRELRLDDAEFIVRLLNEPGFLRFIGDKGVRTLDDAREYLSKGPLESYRRHGFGLYLVSLRQDGAPIGICGLVKRDSLVDPDVGFAFLEAHWSKGYAVESAAAVLRYGRETLGIERIVAITAVENRGSIAVIEKIGLTFERLVRLGDDAKDLKLFGPTQRGSGE
jgi:[ribosomal protein S5]-alanine N-acetyltransferase